MKAIKSVLANRKLFQGGGLVPPGNINPANGILASSESLIDAVVRDAVGPQGGPTMSMDQGGVARFRKGGTGPLPNTTQQSLPAFPSEVVGSMPPSQNEAVRDAAMLQQAQQAFQNGEMTIQRLEEVTSIIIERWGSLFNLESVLPPAQTTREEPPAPNSQIVQAEPPARDESTNVPSFDQAYPAIPTGDVLGVSHSTPRDLTVAEQLASGKPLELDLNRALDRWEDSREYQLRHRYGATNDQINEILGVFPNLTLAELLRGDMTFGALAGDEYSGIRRRSEEEYQASIKKPWGSELEDRGEILPVGPAEALDVTVAEAVLEDSLPPHRQADIQRIIEDPDEPEVVSVAEEALIGDAAATVGDTLPGPLQLVEVEDSTDPTVPPLHVDRKALIAELAQKGKNVGADAQWAAFADVIKQIGQTAKGSGEVDIETLKAEMEALLPTVEDDPQMKGMHLILLGAAIGGGTSSNPWTNVFQGISQQMPNLIKYRASQTAAKRARETAIAKLAIEQKLGIQSEQRAEARAIAAEERGFAIDIQKDLFEKSIAEEAYTVAMTTTIDASAINPDATGKITIPFGTPFSLTNDGLDFFSDYNIPLIPTNKLTLKDMRLAAIGTSVPDPLQLSAKQWKQLSAVSTETIFKNFLGKGAGINYKARFPEAGALYLYPGYTFSKSTVDNSEVLHVQNGYKRATKDHSELFTELNGLRTIALSEGMTGTEKLYDQFASALRGYAGTDKDSMAYHIANSIIGGEGVTTYNAFNAKARLILAKIAPILLGESGKTISDADRERVATALGINIERRYNQDGTVTWVLGENPFSNVLVDPEHISNAITEVQRALSRNLEEINMEMAGFYMRHNRDVPGGVWEEKGMIEDVFQQEYDWDLRAQES